MKTEYFIIIALLTVIALDEIDFHDQKKENDKLKSQLQVIAHENGIYSRMIEGRNDWIADLERQLYLVGVTNQCQAQRIIQLTRYSKDLKSWGEDCALQISDADRAFHMLAIIPMPAEPPLSPKKPLEWFLVTNQVGNLQIIFQVAFETNR